MLVDGLFVLLGWTRVARCNWSLRNTSHHQCALVIRAVPMLNSVFPTRAGLDRDDHPGAYLPLPTALASNERSGLLRLKSSLTSSPNQIRAWKKLSSVVLSPVPAEPETAHQARVNLTRLPDTSIHFPYSPNLAATAPHRTCCILLSTLRVRQSEYSPCRHS
jgi:hypothetical protein